MQQYAGYWINGDALPAPFVHARRAAEDRHAHAIPPMIYLTSYLEEPLKSRYVSALYDRTHSKRKLSLSAWSFPQTIQRYNPESGAALLFDW